MPNCWTAWNARLGRQTVYALRDASEGDELCVSYLGIPRGQPRDGRRESLERDFGFVCACEQCALRGAALRQSDLRQTRIGDLHAEIVSAVNTNLLQDKARFALGQRRPPPRPSWPASSDALTGSSRSSRGGAASRIEIEGTSGGAAHAPAYAPPKAMSAVVAETLAQRLIAERLSLMAAEGLDGTAWLTLDAAYTHCKMVGDKEGAREWAARAADTARAALGDVAEEVTKYALPAVVHAKGGWKQAKR